MITLLLSSCLFLIFSILSGFHFYWFFGGIWGLQQVIPTKEDQAPTLSIPKFATLIVALILITFALMYLIKSGLTTIQTTHWLVNYAYWFIPTLCILRAIGEGNYVGFFKQIKNTSFSEADTKIFSPLCLFIGIIGLLIQFIN